MSLTTAQLWERVHLAGLATPEQCRQWARGVAEVIGQENQTDPALVIKELVHQEKLSAYQANVLYRGLSHPLQLGKLRVVRSLESERGPAWYEGEDTTTARWSAFPPKNLWIVALADEKLASDAVQAWPPSLQWAERHCKVHAPHLDRWMQSGATLKHLYAVCEAVPGLVLREVLEQGPLSVSQAYQLVLDVAAGLKFLHTSKMVHGHLCLDAVVWNEMQGFRLLRDPLFPPSSPYHGSVQSVLGGTEHRLALAAPELFAPNAVPSVATDMYALGCLWYRCLTGQWPIDPGKDAPAENWAKLHANVPITSPERVPATQVRCLMHLLAKDPAVRFANVDALLRALDQLVLPLESTNPASATAPTAAAVNLAASQSSPATVAQSVAATAAPAVPLKPASTTATDAPAKSPVASKAPAASTPSVVTKSQTQPAKPEAPRKTTPVEKSENADLKAKQVAAPKQEAAQKPVSTQKPDAAPKQETAPKQSPVVAAGSPATKPQTSNTTTPAAPTANSATPSVNSAAPSVNSATPSVSKTTPVKGASTSTVAPSVPNTTAPSATAKTSDVGNNVDSRVVARDGSASVAPATSKGVETEQIGSVKPAVEDAANTNAAKKTGSQNSGAKKKRPDGAKGGKAKSGTSSLATAVKKKSKPKKPVWFLPMVIGCSALLLTLLVVVLGRNQKGLVTIQPGKKPSTEQSPTLTNLPVGGTGDKGTGVTVDPILEYFNLQDDSANVPWAPPTVGTPYSTEMLPPGLEAVLFLTKDVFNDSGALSTIRGWWSEVYPQSKGTPELELVAPDAFANLAIGWYPGASVGTYHQVFRWTRKDPGPLDELLLEVSSWKSKTADTGGKKYRYWTKELSGSEIAVVTDDFSTDGDQQVRRLTMGPWELLKPMLESEGKSGPLRRQLDTLLQNTDSRADATFLAAPSFLFGDGKEWLGEHSTKVRDLMREVIDDRVQAILCRVHLQPDLYLEYRMLGNDLQSAARDASELRKKLSNTADAVESQLTAQPASAYWRAIANRFPQMLRALHKYSRSGAEDGQVVFNAYLPKESATNLAIGSWMALQSGVGSGAASTVASTGGAKGAANGVGGAGMGKGDGGKGTSSKTGSMEGKSIDDLLATKVNLRIEQESLEVVLQAIATELKDSLGLEAEPIPMSINGTAFQKDGITRNQQIRNFEYSDTSIRDLLTALVRRANPVTTVQSPNEKDQKVVWLLLDDPNSPTKKKLDLTTRAWADSNNAALPMEFQLPNP